jgi:membrane fusion protein (multidrug efflux system)
MRIGQPVTLTADAYGKSVQYRGTIAGLGVGTGGAFALLPAQNATGNWIKVVQRIPVRIALDPQQLAEHPLRVGLSMEVTVNIADKNGKALASASRVDPAYATTAFERDVEQADTLVRETIAANLGHPLPVNTTNKSALAKIPVTGVALAPRPSSRGPAAAL